MIVFNLLSKNEVFCRMACQEILDAGYALQIFLDENIHEFRLNHGSLEKDRLFKLVFITKARLFDDIERLLSEKIPENDFRLFSNPVTQIDFKEGERIRNQLPDGAPPPKDPTNAS
jgi:hypothetical protein